MTSLLESLPTELLKKILILAGGDTKTVLRCELTCKALGKVVQDDKTWEFVPYAHYQKVDDRLNNRMWACAYTGIRSIRGEQSSRHGVISNILVEELGAEGWNNLVSSVLQSLVPIVAPPIDLDHDQFQFRGDTLYVLAEIVQDLMITSLNQAYMVSIDIATATGRYPLLTKHILERYGRPLNREVELVMCASSRQEPFHATLVRLKEDVTVKDNILRRLSHRAGIVRMENEVFDYAWNLLVLSIFLFVRPACIELIDGREENSCQGQKKRKLTGIETIHMISPLSDRIGTTYWHTLVPRQIENAAGFVFGSLPRKVYGEVFGQCDGSVMVGYDEWFNADHAIAFAEEQYEYEDDSGDESDSENDEESDSFEEDDE